MWMQVKSVPMDQRLTFKFQPVAGALAQHYGLLSR
jgi:hypothetical protein